VYDVAVSETRRDCRNTSAWQARRTLCIAVGVGGRGEFEEATASLRIVSRNEAVVDFLIDLAGRDCEIAPCVRALAQEIVERRPGALAYRMLLAGETERICDILATIDPIRAPFDALVRHGTLQHA
jgi:hypothetical protein